MRGRKKGPVRAIADIAPAVAPDDDVTADDALAVQPQVEAGDVSPAETEEQGTVCLYPRVLRVENNTVHTQVFPLIDKTIPPYSSVDAEFSSSDQLKRFKADVEQINYLLGFADAIKVAGD